jgi:hypothetical protein
MWLNQERLIMLICNRPRCLDKAMWPFVCMDHVGPMDRIPEYCFCTYRNDGPQRPWPPRGAVGRCALDRDARSLDELEGRTAFPTAFPHEIGRYNGNLMAPSRKSLRMLSRHAARSTEEGLVGDTMGNDGHFHGVSVP